jgi:hypothetical protein
MLAVVGPVLAKCSYPVEKCDPRSVFGQDKGFAFARRGLGRYPRTVYAFPFILGSLTDGGHSQSASTPMNGDLAAFPASCDMNRAGWVWQCFSIEQGSSSLSEQSQRN